jgi:four helix bundle protein
VDREPQAVSRERTLQADGALEEREQMNASQDRKSVQSFRDLEVWQRSMELTAMVYRLTKQFPREEIFGITGQLRRAAVSIPSNIAEGQGRLNTREFRQSLGIARGSNCELQTQLEIAHALCYGDQKLLDEATALSHRVGQMLFKLLSILNSKLTER